MLVLCVISLHVEQEGNADVKDFSLLQKSCKLSLCTSCISVTGSKKECDTWLVIFFDGENCIYNITKLIISFSQSVLKVFFDIFLFYCKATFSGAQSKARAGAAKFFLAIQQNTPLDLLQLQKTTKEKYTLNTDKYNERNTLTHTYKNTEKQILVRLHCQILLQLQSTAL